MAIKLFDANKVVFDSSEEVGFSIVTLTELTKGGSEHTRNQYFKKFISIWNKENYHIYLPAELNKLKEELNYAIISNDKNKQFFVLYSMCNKIMTMIFVFFTQIICLLMISIVFSNHDLKIVDGEIPYANSNEMRLATFNNYVVNLFKTIYEHQENIFEGCYKDWKKGAGDVYGNQLFKLLLNKYSELTGEPLNPNVVLCGSKKNIASLFLKKDKRMSKDKLENIYKSYFPYKNNGELTQKLFIPYLLDAINEDKTKFEFNHISDAFLIFNALTVQKTEAEEINIDSTDETVIKMFSHLKEFPF